MAVYVFEGYRVTDFIGISFGVRESKILAVAASNGLAIAHVEGLSMSEILAFLWSLRLEIENRTPKPAFVAFQMSVDFELLFAGMSREDKNRLFGIRRELEETVNDIPLYDPDRKHDIVEYDGFNIYHLPGKLIRLSTPKRPAMVLYDISSYFESEDLSDAAFRYCAIRIQRIARNDLPLWHEAIIDELTARCVREAEVIAELGAKIEATVSPVGLVPRQWYGPSAIASKALNKWGARKQGKKLNEKNAPYELIKAIDCAYFGGRVEAIKLGTIKDVRVFDLNSAYAYATCFLSQFHRPLRHCREYKPDEPFSVWYVDYKLPKDTLIGVLPTRSPSGGLSYRLSGRGYYWQPEVEYLRLRYPDCVEIGQGYACDYEQVTFAPQIESLYEYRMKLKDAGDEGQTIVKLALSNLYGKFAQNKGAAYFQCRAWAGWITAFIRRLLLEAVTGVEESVISFNQDAVHLQGFEASAVLQGTGLGAWKRSAYPQGLYLSPGIYQLETHSLNVPDKLATCGSNSPLDYGRIASDLSLRQASELSRAFFVGWNLAYHLPVQYQKDYLSEVSESLNLIPSRLRSRNYLSKFDWSNEHRSSTINTNDSGLPSSRYSPLVTVPTTALHLRLKDRGWS